MSNPRNIADWMIPPWCDLSKSGTYLVIADIASRTPIDIVYMKPITQERTRLCDIALGFCILPFSVIATRTPRFLLQVDDMELMRAAPPEGRAAQGVLVAMSLPWRLQIREASLVYDTPGPGFGSMSFEMDAQSVMTTAPYQPFRFCCANSATAALTCILPPATEACYQRIAEGIMGNRPVRTPTPASLLDLND